MSRRTRRRNRGRPVLVRDLMVLLVLFAVVSVLSLAASLARSPVIILAIVAVGAGAFYAGRRYERRSRGKLPAAVQRRPPGESRADLPERSTRPLPKVPAVADQVAELERLAGRPIDIIIASYQTIQRRYGGKP